MNPVNLPKMDIAKYEQYLSKSLNEGVKDGMSGTEKLNQMVSNIAHNIMAFVKQVHTYVNEGKWINDERVAKSIDKKFVKLEKAIDELSTFDQSSILKVKDDIHKTGNIFAALEKAGVPHSEIEKFEAKIKLFDDKVDTLNAEFKKLRTDRELSRTKYEEKIEKQSKQITVPEGSVVKDHSGKHTYELENRGEIHKTTGIHTQDPQNPHVADLKEGKGIKGWKREEKKEIE